MTPLLEILARIAELERKLINVVRIGVIEEIDYTTALAKVRLEPNLLTTGLPWTTRRAHTENEWWAPEVGEQVVVLAPAGELNQGVIDRSLHQTAYPPAQTVATIHSVTYADGAVISYDRENHALSAVLPSGATVDLTADGGITITGDVSITGNLVVDGDASATGDVSDSAGAVSRLRGNYNAHTHIGNMGSPTGPTDHLDQ